MLDKLQSQGQNQYKTHVHTYLCPIVFKRGKRIEKACVVNSLKFVEDCRARKSRLQIHVASEESRSESWASVKRMLRVSETKECQNNTTLSLLSYTLADAQINRKNNAGDPRVLCKVPSLKLSIPHVHCDWQTVSNSTNQNRFIVNTHN